MSKWTLDNSLNPDFLNWPLLPTRFDQAAVSHPETGVNLHSSSLSPGLWSNLAGSSSCADNPRRLTNHRHIGRLLNLGTKCFIWFKVEQTSQITQRSPGKISSIQRRLKTLFVNNNKNAYMYIRPWFEYVQTASIGLETHLFYFHNYYHHIHLDIWVKGEPVIRRWCNIEQWWGQFDQASLGSTYQHGRR